MTSFLSQSTIVPPLGPGDITQDGQPVDNSPYRAQNKTRLTESSPAAFAATFSDSGCGCDGSFFTVIAATIPKMSASSGWIYFIVVAMLLWPASICSAFTFGVSLPARVRNVCRNACNGTEPITEMNACMGLQRLAVHPLEIGFREQAQHFVVGHTPVSASARSIWPLIY